MRITILLPDELVSKADVVAERLGISRAALVAAAVAEFVGSRRAVEVTKRLDEIYITEPSGLDPGLRAAQRRTIRREEW